MKVRPLQDRVLVKRVESETRSAGGIIIPDTAKEKPLEGLVIAVGPGKRLEDGSRVAPEVKEGDRVLFGKYAGYFRSSTGIDTRKAHYARIGCHLRRLLV